MKRAIYTEEHEAFRGTVREFLRRDVAPYHDEWERAGVVDKAVYARAAEQGVVGFWVPEKFGGLGVDDFRYNAIVQEEQSRSGLSGMSLRLYNDIIAPYLLNLASPEQQERWLPGQATGECLFAIAMSEPDAGSDLANIRTSAAPDGDAFVLNGQKTFITNAYNADAVIVFARTDPAAGHKGFSLLVVEDGMPGFERAGRLTKLGLKAQDTAELSFADVRVPRENLLGVEGRGFYHLMENLAQERLSIAIAALAQARATFDATVEYTKTRTAFGRPIGSMQANKHLLANMVTELDIAQVYIDECLRRVLDGELTAVDAAKAKLWVAETAVSVVNRCLQLHGGYGYMLEYPVAKSFIDTRYMTIGGGSSEIMREIIGKDMGL